MTQDGILPGVPLAIAQTRDGYLWFGTDVGLNRWVNAKLIGYPGANGWVQSILEDRDARIWFTRYEKSDRTTDLCFAGNEKIKCYGKGEGLGQINAAQLAQDAAGDLWIAAASDKDWQEAGNRRQALYTDLSPGKYRFRMITCNHDGVWNEEGAALDFSIAPAWYQTYWFRLACVAAFFVLLWTIYRLRLHQLANEFQTKIEASVGERTRIAGELHDTLLQSLHGLMFRFQAARNMLPLRPQEAMEALDCAITRTEQAIAESRNAIKDLRGAPAPGDLAELLTAIGQELVNPYDADRTLPIFSTTVEGQPRPLCPSVQDEVCRIAHEVLTNAFRHAEAHRIETEIRYDRRSMRLRFRDDGKGIDPEILQMGRRPGHWGLPGTRERAQRIGARLDFWSEAGAGTEIQLSVPAAKAYRGSPDRSRLGLIGRWRNRVQRP